MSWFDFSGQKPTNARKNKNRERRETKTRRSIQRRECFRLVYPPQVAPQITNIQAQVVDISVKSVRFLLETNITIPLNTDESEKLPMSIKFHDGEIINVTGTFAREGLSTDGRMFYIYYLTKEISGAIINKEQAFLLKHFPNFCRGKFSK
jgi:hypothetical protein